MTEKISITLVDYKLTEKEAHLIEVLRQINISYGKLPCVIHYQAGNLHRIEMDKYTEDVLL